MGKSTMGNDSDIALMRQLAGGSEEALRHIIDRHREPLFRLAYGLLGDRPAAEDVVQDSFIRLWRKARRYDPRYSLSTWLYRIACNRCYDELRRRRRHREAVVQAFESMTDADFLEAEELLALLHRATAQLPPKQRMVYQLREVEGLSAEEAASAIGMTPDQLKANLYAARNAVREKLKKYGI